MSRLRVLISGASIAGPTAAYWFARAGASVTVVERFPALRTSGQSVDIRTAGVTVMQKMPGMEEAVRARSTQIEGMRLVNAQGASIGTIEATGDASAQSLVSEFEIFRRPRPRPLRPQYRPAAARPLRVWRADRLHHAACFERRARACHLRQRLPLSLRLRPRRRCRWRHLPHASAGPGLWIEGPHLHVNAWAAYFSTPRDFLKGTKVGHGYSAAPGRALIAGPDPFTGCNTIMLLRLAPRDEVDRTAAFREVSAQGEAALRDFIASHFQGCGWRSDEMVECMREADDLYASEWVQIKVPRLSKGRFVLIGDAGCAPGPTGTGTSLAMASAYLLAGEICRSKGDVLTGLRAFEERMAPIVADMQKIPPGVPGIMAPQTGWGLALRNAAFWGGTRAAKLGGRFAWALAWVGRSWSSSFGGDKYGLPDYDWV